MRWRERERGVPTCKMWVLFKREELNATINCSGNWRKRRRRTEMGTPPLLLLIVLFSSLVFLSSNTRSQPVYPQAHNHHYRSIFFWNWWSWQLIHPTVEFNQVKWCSFPFLFFFLFFFCVPFFLFRSGNRMRFTRINYFRFSIVNVQKIVVWTSNVIIAWSCNLSTFMNFFLVKVIGTQSLFDHVIFLTFMNFFFLVKIINVLN